MWANIAVCSDIDPCCIYAPKDACYRRPRQEDRGQRKGCIWLSKATWVNFTAKCCEFRCKNVTVYDTHYNHKTFAPDIRFRIENVPGDHEGPELLGWRVTKYANACRKP